jgi:hypothetical protein
MATKNVTMHEAIEKYLAHLEATAKPPTRRVYAKILKLVEEHFGADRDLRKMMPAHAAAFLRSDAVEKKPDGKPRAPVSAEQIRRVLRQVLQFAKAEGLIDTIPLPKDEAAKAAKADARKAKAGTGNAVEGDAVD